MFICRRENYESLYCIGKSWANKATEKNSLIMTRPTVYVLN